MIYKSFLSKEKIENLITCSMLYVPYITAYICKCRVSFPKLKESFGDLSSVQDGAFQLTLWLSTSFPAVDLPCENPSLLVINRVQKGNRVRVGKLKKSRQKHF